MALTKHRHPPLCGRQKILYVVISSIREPWSRQARSFQFPVQMTHEQRLVASFSIHLPAVLLQPNGGTHGSWSSTPPACRFHRAQGLSTSPADPQRRSLRRRGVSWDGRFMLTSPWWSTLGLQPWPGTLSWWVDYSVHKQWMKVVNSGQPWFATAQHVLAGIAGKSLKGILHQYLACWQMQHQSKKKTRQIEKNSHGFSQKAMTVSTTTTWNIEIWTPGKCWDTSTPPGHTKSTADPFDGSVIIDPHG